MREFGLTEKNFRYKLRDNMRKYAGGNAVRRVFMIFTDDIKHLLKNPIAIIVTIGLIILPSLYAWFNILPTGTLTEILEI